MKFGQLPVGTRFDYEGARYLKTGPLVATPEDGGQQRFLGRYADVRVLGAASAPAEAAADWRAAFDALYSECLTTIECLDAHDPQAATQARARLQAAREQFLTAMAQGAP